jgi:4-coumarate--CoA ligase
MTAEDVAARLVQAEARLIVTDSEMLSMAELASVLAGVIPIVSMDPSQDDTVCLKDLVESGDASASHFKLETTERTEAFSAFINRTSGSTGNMKSVITTHAHYIATMEATRRTISENTEPDRDTWLSSISLGFFINAKLHMSLNVLLGIPVVLMRKPLDEATIDVIGRHQITFVFMTPPVAAKIAKSGISSADVSSIKWLLSAGASICGKLREAIAAKFSGVDLTLEWGTSETMLIAIQTDESSRCPGSSGTLVGGMQAKVIDTKTGEELGESKRGEILVRNSLARFAGYKDNEAANRDFDAEGWFHTGDYGFLDANCNVFIIDRLKELLRVGDGYGSRISATELENVLYEHPAVKTVVVVGIYSNSTQTDHPTAFIVLQPEYQTSAGAQLAQSIEEFAGHKLRGLKRLSGGVHFVPSYPTVGFKVDRRKLKSMVNLESPVRSHSSRIVELVS